MVRKTRHPLLSPLPGALRFAFLVDEPAAADLAAQWHDAEWGSLYPGTTAATWRANFAREHSDGSLPFTLALFDGDRLAGSVSVTFDDCPARPDLNPWLASFYVRPEDRGRGFGWLLLAEALRLAAKSRLRELYVFTETAEGLFRRHGFEPFAREVLEGHGILILRRTFCLA